MNNENTVDELMVGRTDSDVYKIKKGTNYSIR